MEGQTEETFVNRILKPHLAPFSVGVSAHVVVTKRVPGYTYGGGLSRYAQAESDINLLLKQDQGNDVRFTTMFDLYRLPNDFPGYAAAVHSDPYRRVEALENALKQEIPDSRFTPYIQLHEFEALLLSDPQKFDSQFDYRADGISRLVELVSQFTSPELINDGDSTAPSKRIDDEIPEYKYVKASAGPLVAGKIGIPTLRSKCAHFAEWLAKLENLGR
ncbi:MAG: DUF4276 family protein [Caldilineaceae bacterium]|nr:DUF4276 family protein [Caldilineaceae bacterium]